MSKAHADVRTGEVAEPFVVVLRALRPAVTHVPGVQAHSGSTAAVEAGTGEAGTVLLVLSARTVVHTVTSDVHRQAVAVVCTKTHGGQLQTEKRF